VYILSVIAFRALSPEILVYNATKTLFCSIMPSTAITGSNIVGE
jgi:hypothetical protein